MVTIDRKRRCFRINLEYDSGNILVELQPDVRRHGFTALTVSREDGEQLSREDAEAFSQRAQKELLAWFKDLLKPKVPHHVVNLNTRVELAFVLTLQIAEQDGSLEKLAPLDLAVIKTLQGVARDISSSITLQKQQARNQARPSTGYFVSVRDNHLRDWFKDIPCSDDQYEFFRSVLGRTFAWKGGRVPNSDYEKAMRCREGFWLALKIK